MVLKTRKNTRTPGRNPDEPKKWESKSSYKVTIFEFVKARHLKKQNL